MRDWLEEEEKEEDSEAGAIMALLWLGLLDAALLTVLIGFALLFGDLALNIIFTIMLYPGGRSPTFALVYVLIALIAGFGLIIPGVCGLRDEFEREE